jgi:hypothetical protein
MKKQKTKRSRSKVRRILYKDSYPAVGLALALIAIVFLEGMMFGVTTGADLAKGVEILDMSESVKRAASDLAMLAEPLVDSYSAVDQFYLMASAEVMNLLEDNIVTQSARLIHDVNEFYRIASSEMAGALDLSGTAVASSYSY